MSFSAAACQIPGNSDIAGIGVRAAVYVQACLACFNLMYICVRHALAVREDERQAANATAEAEKHSTGDNLKDASTPLEAVDISTSPVVDPRLPSRTQSERSSEISIVVHKFVDENVEYLGMEKALERSLLMVGLAVILSAILEAKSTTGLSAYHALTVLNVSQINNWAGYLLLHLTTRFRVSRVVGGWAWSRRLFLTKESFISSLPCMLHSIAMSGFGLYFWTHVKSFFEYTAHAPQQPCQPLAYLWVMGPVDISNNTLRIASIVFYAVGLVPIFDLYVWGFVLVMVTAVTMSVVISLGLTLLTILALFCSIAYFLVVLPIIRFIVDPIFEASYSHKPSRVRKSPSLLPSKRLRMTLKGFMYRIDAGADSAATWFLYPLGLCVSAPLIYTIIATELTIHTNEINVTDAENKWTYGQTLALFSALVAIYLNLRQGLCRLHGIANVICSSFSPFQNRR